MPEPFKVLMKRRGDGENQTAVTGIFGSLQDSFNKTFIVEDRYQLILQGLWTTVVISLLSCCSVVFSGH